MGVLLITPIMLTFPELRRIRSWARIAEFVAGLFLLTMVCFIIFGDLPLIPIRLHILAFAVLPFVIWAAIRFGVSGEVLATFLIALIVTVSTESGSGPFATNTPLVNAVLLDVFFGVLSVTGLTLAAVCVERDQLLGQKTAVETQLRADESVRESEDKLRLILDSTAEGIYGIDLEHRCTFCNSACVRTLGYERVDE